MQHIQTLAETLAELARGAGFVVTIEQVPLEPLAMGNHEDRVTVRPLREQADQPSAGQVDERALFEEAMRAQHGADLAQDDMDALWSELPGYAWRRARASLTPTAPQAASQQAGADEVSRWLDRDGRMTNAMRDFIQGMSVSMDVSTGEHDAGHRYFGIINEVMDDANDKHGVTLLVYDAEPNFAAPQAAPTASAGGAK